MPAGSPGDDNWNDKIFLHITDTKGDTATVTHTLEMAAYAGYRAIGLSYDSFERGDDICTDGSKLACTEDCGRRVRTVKITGNNDSGLTWQVEPKDSIAYRLLDALGALYTADMADGVNDMEWENYCLPENHGSLPSGSSLPWEDRIIWRELVVSGFSQGSGHAALISMRNKVNGLNMLDGANDQCINGSNVQVTAPYYATMTNQSANRPRFGALHVANDPTVPQSWTDLNYDAAAMDIDSSWTTLTKNVVDTDQNPPAGCDEHGTLGNDDCMPTEGSFSSNPAVPATSPNNAHVYESYLEGFCSLE